MSQATMIIKRVPYGKESTPPELREYKLAGVGGSPVGTITEWKEWAKKHGYDKIAVADKDITEVNVE